MSIRKSVRISDEAAEQCHIVARLHKNQSNSINWSGSLNAIASEYSLVMEDSKPELTDEQWFALKCAYNGYFPSRDPKEEANLLPWHVSEGYGYDEQINEALGDQESALKFIDKLRAFSITQKLSIIYHVKKYWAGV